MCDLKLNLNEHFIFEVFAEFTVLLYLKIPDFFFKNRVVKKNSLHIYWHIKFLKNTLTVWFTFNYRIFDFRWKVSVRAGVSWSGLWRHNETFVAVILNFFVFNHNRRDSNIRFSMQVVSRTLYVVLRINTRLDLLITKI